MHLLDYVHRSHRTACRGAPCRLLAPGLASGKAPGVQGASNRDREDLNSRVDGRRHRSLLPRPRPRTLDPCPEFRRWSRSKLPGLPRQTGLRVMGKKLEQTRGHQKPGTQCGKSCNSCIIGVIETHDRSTCSSLFCISPSAISCKPVDSKFVVQTLSKLYISYYLCLLNPPVP